jgi:hypothetical protein
VVPSHASFLPLSLEKRGQLELWEGSEPSIRLAQEGESEPPTLLVQEKGSEHPTHLLLPVQEKEREKEQKEGLEPPLSQFYSYPHPLFPSPSFLCAYRLRREKELEPAR